MPLATLQIYSLILEVVTDCNELCKSIRSRADYDLADQLSRAVLSVSNNFAEGYGRIATGERLMFMSYADGSVQECRNGIKVALIRQLVPDKLASVTILTLGRISIGIIELSAAFLDKDQAYKGLYRKLIQQRRQWRFKTK